MRLTRYVRHKIAIEERLNILAQMQQEEERLGTIQPSPYLWLKRHHNFLKSTGAILLGLSLGLLAVIFNFIIFVSLLHIEL